VIQILAKIIGKAMYNFVDEKTKKEVERTSLYVMFEEEPFEGNIATKVSIENHLIPAGGYAVGDSLEVQFNSKGKLKIVLPKTTSADTTTNLKLGK